MDFILFKRKYTVDHFLTMFANIRTFILGPGGSFSFDSLLHDNLIKSINGIIFLHKVNKSIPVLRSDPSDDLYGFHKCAENILIKIDSEVILQSRHSN